MRRYYTCMAWIMRFRRGIIGFTICQTIAVSTCRCKNSVCLFASVSITTLHLLRLADCLQTLFYDNILYYRKTFHHPAASMGLQAHTDWSQCVNYWPAVIVQHLLQQISISYYRTQRALAFTISVSTRQYLQQQPALLLTGLPIGVPIGLRVDTLFGILRQIFYESWEYSRPVGAYYWREFWATAVQELSSCRDGRPFGHNRHGTKVGRACCGGWVGGSPFNTMWPGPRPTSLPSGILIYPTVWPQL